MTLGTIAYFSPFFLPTVAGEVSGKLAAGFLLLFFIFRMGMARRHRSGCTGNFGLPKRACHLETSCRVSRLGVSLLWCLDGFSHEWIYTNGIGTAKN